MAALSFGTGLRRSFDFWSQVMPIYLHYEGVNWLTKSKPAAEADAEFEKLHNKFAEGVPCRSDTAAGMRRECWTSALTWEGTSSSVPRCFTCGEFKADHRS